MFKFINHDGAAGIEITEHLGITKQAVSKILDYIEKSAYVIELHPVNLIYGIIF